MPEGAPPPWLINMQRYGPPPSYPQLKILGLNASVPPGGSFGYRPGGWGKPRVDEEPVEKTKHCGDVAEEEEKIEEEIEEEKLGAGIQSVDSLSSTPTGVETPYVIDLQKQQRKEPEKNLLPITCL